MSTHTETSAPAGQEASSAPASTGLRRFEPADGMFLRAEHLEQIQTYAADLAALNGQAGGPGVVYGYTLTHDDAKQSLSATPGLAYDPAGHPLRSNGVLHVDLSGLDPSGIDRVWIVEVVSAAEIPGGSEPRYSSVCATSCGSESSFQPWRDDAVRLRVRAETVAVQGDMLSAGNDSNRRRSVLAAAYFESERRRGGPWLTPTAPGGVIPHLVTFPWSKAGPPGPPVPGAVPVGLLYADQTDAQHFHLDVWTARRDRVLSPPASAWENHLSRRPLPVFTAQLLQFQDQLAAGYQDLEKKPLPEQFVELPPAGFLPRPEWGNDDDDWLSVLTRIFGGAVLPKPVSVTADTAISAVNLAQHLDRIPLRPEVGTLTPVDMVERGSLSGPEVLVLVPDIRPDLPALSPGGFPHYPWIAFVRKPEFLSLDGETRKIATAVPAFMQRSEPRVDGELLTPVHPLHQAQPAPQLKSVPLHVLAAPLSRAQYPARIAEATAETPTAEARFAGLVATVSTEASDAVHAAIDVLGPHRMIDVVATTAEPDGQPEAAARAKSLANELGLDSPDKPAGINSRVVSGPDSIFILVRKR